MILRTYKELNRYFEMFRKGHCDLLIVMSRAGLCKTFILKRKMRNEEYVYVNTHSTPLQTYLTLFDKKDCPVVFDDIDGLLRNQIMVSMLKALTDTTDSKELHYNSTSSLLGNAPESFKTSSKVCILLNEFDVHSETLKPIIDRSFFIEFIPSKKEILKKIFSIEKSQNMPEMRKCVSAFIKEYCCEIKDLSARTYMKALQLYDDDETDWKERFMQLVGFDEKVIEYLKLQEQYPDQEERIKHYSGSRATYFRVKKEIEENHKTKAKQNEEK